MGSKVDKKYIQRLAKTTKITRPWDNSLDEVKEETSKCYKEYKNLIPQAFSIRDDFMDTLALEKSEKNGTSFEVERKKLSTIQHQRKLARAAKLIRRKMGKNPTVKVLSTLRDEDGNVIVDDENKEVKVEHILKCDIEDVKIIQFYKLKNYY